MAFKIQLITNLRTRGATGQRALIMFIPDFFERLGDGYIYREGDGEMVVMCEELDFFEYIQYAYEIDRRYTSYGYDFWRDYGHHEFYLEFFYQLNK